MYLSTELLKKKKAPGLAKGRKFKKNSDFWMYEKKIRFWIRKTIKKQWFYWFVILLVFFNTCSVAVEHYDQPKWLTEFLGQYDDEMVIEIKFSYYNKYEIVYNTIWQRLMQGRIDVIRGPLLRYPLSSWEFDFEIQLSWHKKVRRLCGPSYKIMWP